MRSFSNIYLWKWDDWFRDWRFHYMLYFLDICYTDVWKIPMVVKDDECVVSAYDMLPLNIWCSMLRMSSNILEIDTQLSWIAARIPIQKLQWSISIRYVHICVDVIANTYTCSFGYYKVVCPIYMAYCQAHHLLFLVFWSFLKIVNFIKLQTLWIVNIAVRPAFL